MTPDYKIEANGQDVTNTIRDRFISMSIMDEAGLKSDTCDIELDDRDGLIELPDTGAELKISLGYRETGLTEMGLWVVDEPELVSPPQAIVLKAHAATFANSATIKGMEGTLKEPRTAGWDNVTLADVVNTIAKRHGYEARIGDDLAAVQLSRIDQLDESDMNLLTRLAKDHGATFKAGGGTLLFVKRGAGKSASGRQLDPVIITAGEEESYRVTMPDRGKYKAVIAHYYDTAKAKRIPVRVGDANGPVRTLPGDRRDEMAAWAAAQAEMERIKRGAATLHMTLPGRPEIAAETPLVLQGYRAGVAGKWSAIRVTHDVRGKFMTILDAEAAS